MDSKYTVSKGVFSWENNWYTSVQQAEPGCESSSYLNTHMHMDISIQALQTPVC